ncbi:MAG: DNA repair protein RadC [Anaerolineae bacterium]|nr:DNA repair protein RadC [Anaerolineae bacterium]
MGEESHSGYRISDMEVSERPRERLARLGPEILSNAELLAILLRVGVAGENVIQVAQRLLIQFGGLPGLHKASFTDLCDARGMGEAKAAQLKAAIELGKRLSSTQPDDRARIHSPKEAADLVLYEMSAFDQEHLWVLVLDTRNQVLYTDRLYKGSVNTSLVRVGELFRSAVQRNAAAIILVHNHPSGDPTPSPEDMALTRAAIQAGKTLDIEVLDHLVIGFNRYVSMKEKNLAFG